MNGSLYKTNCVAIVHVLALATLFCWSSTLTAAQTRTNKKKLVVTMDTRSLPYDPENEGKRSNTDEILTILKTVKGLSIMRFDTSLEWRKEKEVKAKNPDLILIHWSAFAASPPRSNEKLGAESDKFNSFLRYMSDSKSLVLVYTRQWFPDQSAGYKLLIEQWVRTAPQLKGRIEIFEFVPGKPQRFRDPAVQEALKLRVKRLLGLD